MFKVGDVVTCVLNKCDGMINMKYVHGIKEGNQYVITSCDSSWLTVNCCSHRFDPKRFVLATPLVGLDKELDELRTMGYRDKDDDWMLSLLLE